MEKNQNSNGKVTFELNNGEVCNLYPPVLKESYLLRGIGGGKGFCRVLDLRKPFSVAFNGAKGGGKTALLSVIGCVAMALNIPVFTNFPLAFFLQKNDGNIELKKCQILNLETFIKLSGELKYAYVALSEYQNWANAYRSNSDVNMALGKALQQMRKRELSIYYDVQEESWVDPVTRVIADVNIWCEDLSFRYPKKYEEGEKFKLTCWDRTGKWTGFPHHLYPRPPVTKEVYFKPFWSPLGKDENGRPYPSIFDSHYVLDPYEAMALRGGGLRDMLLGKNGNGKKPLTHRERKEVLIDIFNSTNKIRPKELHERFKAVGQKEQSDIREFILDMGIRETRITGKTYYVLPKEDVVV